MIYQSKISHYPYTDCYIINSMMVGCCFKLLEDQSAARDKSLRELLVQVLGHLVFSYNQTLGVVLKAVQMLQHFEHLVSPLAQIIQSISQHFQSTSIATDIIRCGTHVAPPTSTSYLLQRACKP